MPRYDIAVIGAGSAGFSAAITAADEGAQVALIGHGTIGGTCVNVGCVPSKTMIRATETLRAAATARRFDGIDASARITDWASVVRQKQALVDDMRQAKYSDLLQAYDSVAYLEGKACFSDKGKLTLNGKPLDAGKIIIASGSRPALPSINGIRQVPALTSTTALALEQLPKSLLVIGAGYIGVELAQMFSRAGVRVTLVSRRGLLPEAEPEISQALTAVFEAEGIRCVSGIVYDRIEGRAGDIRLHVLTDKDRKILEAEAVLIAAGRSPNFEDLNLAAAGIGLNDNGGIAVNRHMRTSSKNVYAAGDVTGRDQFVYMAAYGARLAARNALNGDSHVYDNSAMSAVVFTDPQVASAGHTEASAKAAGLLVRTSVLSLDKVPRALAARDTRGLIKLVAGATTKTLVGAHVLAPEGADSIQTAALAIKVGMSYEQLGGMIFPYLTTVEGLKLAAQTFEMDVSRLSCCAG